MTDQWRQSIPHAAVNETGERRLAVIQQQQQEPDEYKETTNDLRPAVFVVSFDSSGCLPSQSSPRVEILKSL